MYLKVSSVVELLYFHMYLMFAAITLQTVVQVLSVYKRIINNSDIHLIFLLNILCLF